METIVDKFVLPARGPAHGARVAITLAPEARTYLAKKGFDPSWARGPSRA
jgi:hypothetical protein